MKNEIKTTVHVPVLLKETIDGVNPKSGVFVDATLGGGGHTMELVRRLTDKNGKSTIMTIDQDEDSIERFSHRLEKMGFAKTKKGRFEKGNIEIIVRKSNFENLSELLKEENIEKVNGIFADLGMSTDQLEDKDRGFSYRSGKKLDLRMNKDLGVTGADLLNVLYKKELMKLFDTFGDLREANKISNKVIEFRKTKKIETVSDLVSIIEKAVDFDSSRKIKARVIQALRIAVNNELGSLTAFLPQALESLASKGRISIITFHSGEDRIVKRMFREEVQKGLGTDELIYPTETEMNKNPKSTSAKLRVFCLT